MIKRKREKQFYKYPCSITAEEYIVTQEAKHPGDLVSVKAWYDLNPDKDDRPLVAKKRLGLLDPAPTETPTGEKIQ